MKILVTGGAGFIGSHVVDRLQADGHRVTVIDDLSTGSRANLAPSTSFVEADIRADHTPSLVAQTRPDVVVHCAAQASVASSFADPVADAATNVLGTIRVLEGAVAGGASRFVYITTGGALYGQPLYLPADEGHPVSPLSPYGLSKWLGEKELELLAPPSLSLTVLRLANVYGPRQGSRGEAGVIGTFCRRMSRGELVEIHGDGLQTRDFVSVLDVAEAVGIATRSTTASPLCVNIGTGKETSIRQVFDTLAGIAAYPRQPLAAAARQGDVRHSSLDPRLATASLGWTATTPLDQGLRMTYAWHVADRSQISD